VQLLDVPDDSRFGIIRHMPRRQKGQLIRTTNAFFIRYYITDEAGNRKQKCEKLVDCDDQYRTAKDVRDLYDRVMARVNGDGLPSQVGVCTYVECYLPWIKKNKAAPTYDGYRKYWTHYWKAEVGNVTLGNLQTVQVTKILTKLAESGLSSRTLSHAKWFLSGLYQHAVASGIVFANPVPNAKWLCRVDRVAKQPEYSLDEVLAMLRTLEPLDLRAAVAVALAYFAALRPAEIRGLMWEDWRGEELEDWRGEELNVKRSVWRSHVGEGKTEESVASVPLIEPARSLLERLRAQSTGLGYILKGASASPVNLDSLNVRVIAPAMKKAGIAWRGFYPGRRGISSLVTDTSKNALNSTGLLRHANPSTTLKHYTRAQKDSIAAALKMVEKLATMRRPTESVQ
jgi:integrase